MSSNIVFNPMLVGNANGFFGVTSDGYSQGIAFEDPATRYNFAYGQMATTETLPMWGAIAISESLPASTSNGHAGNQITRATSAAAITGFTIYNNASNANTWPQNTAPVWAPPDTVGFARLGSGVRLPVQCDPDLAGFILATGSITQNVSWDFNNQCLQAYDASTATYSVTSMTPTFSSTTGITTIAIVMGVASLVAGVGDRINISGAVNGGTGTNAQVNGNFAVTAFTDNQHFSIQVPGTTSGQIASITGTIVLNAGTGALACKILGLNIGNSQIVQWDGTYANWVLGTCALIQI